MLATRYINEFYKSEEEYYFAIADALHDEYCAIVDAGFLLQIDDVSLPGRHRLLVLRGETARVRPLVKLGCRGTESCPARHLTRKGEISHVLVINERPACR